MIRALAVLLILLTGCSVAAPSIPTKVPAPSPGVVGKATTGDGVELTVIRAQRQATNGGSAPQAGNSFVSIQVTIRNAEKPSLAIAPAGFAIEDSTGKRYSALATTPDPALQASDLAKGGQAAGLLAFEVPANASGLTLLYTPTDKNEPFRVALDL